MSEQQLHQEIPQSDPTDAAEEAAHSDAVPMELIEDEAARESENANDDSETAYDLSTREFRHSVVIDGIHFPTLRVIALAVRGLSNENLRLSQRPVGPGTIDFATEAAGPYIMIDGRVYKRTTFVTLITGNHDLVMGDDAIVPQSLYRESSDSFNNNDVDPNSDPTAAQHQWHWVKWLQRASVVICGIAAALFFIATVFGLMASIWTTKDALTQYFTAAGMHYPATIGTMATVGAIALATALAVKFMELCIKVNYLLKKQPVPIFTGACILMMLCLLGVIDLITPLLVVAIK